MLASLTALRGSPLLGIARILEAKNWSYGAATHAGATSDAWSGLYEALLSEGMKPHLAPDGSPQDCALALKICKKGGHFDREQVKRPAA